MAIFTPDAGMTLQEMLAQRDLQSAQPSLSQADSPLSFQYQNEEYPNSSGSKLYRDRLGPFSDKRQVEDPDAYYNQARNIETLTGNPFMGNRDRYDDAPFARQSGDYYAGDYVNYDETIDRPYQGDWEWQKGYEPDLKGRREYDPMLMEAFINQRNGLPQNLGVKKNVSEPTIDYSNVMGRDLEADDGAQIVDGLTSPYTIRGQIANDLRDVAAIPGRIKDGIMNSAPVEFIGEQFNKAKEGIMGSSAMDFFRGLPTPGNLLMNMAATRNPLSPRSSNYNPTLQGQVDFMKDQGMYGKNPNSGLGQITGGRLTGKHLVSGFGSNDLGKMYGKDLSKLEGYLETMPQRFSRLMKNNPTSYQNKINNLNKKIAQNKREAEQAQAAREAATAARAMARNPQVYANAGITSGGFASQNTGTNSNFSNRTGRGRTGYSEGGLASMFTRKR
jgi:hypothetical protein